MHRKVKENLKTANVSSPAIFVGGSRPSRYPGDDFLRLRLLDGSGQRATSPAWPPWRKRTTSGKIVGGRADYIRSQCARRNRVAADVTRIVMHSCGAGAPFYRLLQPHPCAIYSTVGSHRRRHPANGSAQDFLLFHRRNCDRARQSTDECRRCMKSMESRDCLLRPFDSQFTWPISRLSNRRWRRRDPWAPAIP